MLRGNGARQKGQPDDVPGHAPAQNMSLYVRTAVQEFGAQNGADDAQEHHADDETEDGSLPLPSCGRELDGAAQLQADRRVAKTAGEAGPLVGGEPGDRSERVIALPEHGQLVVNILLGLLDMRDEGAGRRQSAGIAGNDGGKHEAGPVELAHIFMDFGVAGGAEFRHGLGDPVHPVEHFDSLH